MAQQRKPAFSARSPIWPRVPAQIAVLHFQTLLVIDVEVLDEAVHKLPFLQQRSVISLEVVAEMTPARLPPIKPSPVRGAVREERPSERVSAVGSLMLWERKNLPPNRHFTSGEIWYVL